jgi:hypothetical protein
MPEIIFSMPLTGKRHDDQWAEAQRRLQTTLGSLANQTDQDWRAVITGHERPGIDALDDPRVTFLVSKHPKPADKNEFTRDKVRKQRSNHEWIAARGGGDVVLADADDLFHRDFVAYIRRMNHPNGHSIRLGYVFELVSGKLAPIPGAWTKTFDCYCGSSAVLRLTPDEMRGDDCRQRQLGAHGAIFENSIKTGRPLNAIDWHAAVYVLGGAETASVGVLRTPERQAQLHEIIARKAMPIPQEIIDAFALQPLVDECATRSS